MHGENMKLTE